MSLPVTIENEALRLEVWPAVGGKIASLVDKADKFDLLFQYPAELPTAPRYDTPYINSWYEGWDECFPAISPSKYKGHPYDGVAVPDHGELWGIPTTAVPTKDGITTIWHGLRFGYRLSRAVTLEGSSLVAEYTLHNLAPFQFCFVWAAHALMTATVPIELELREGLPIRVDSTEADISPQSATWPRVDAKTDLSQFDALPGRRSWKVFTMDAIEDAVVVRYPTRGRIVRIEYSSEDNLPAYWGIWINTGGWAGQKHIAIEPTTGRHDSIEASIKDRSAGSVAASGKVSWQVRWTVE
jgi:hypothetical protein